jgi:hypothetical protein
MDSDSDSDSEGKRNSNSSSNSNASDDEQEHDNYNYGNDDNDDVRENNVARASNINHNNADAERPTTTILPRRPLDSNQDHGDHTSNSDGVQTTANINANPDNTPASQKSTASHTSRNPSTLTAFNLLHNRPSGGVLDDCSGPLSNSIRIYFQNANGLRTSANGLDILEFYCQMKDIDATIFGINKVNQDTQHP